ncbi:MAG: hypothetical protein JWM95_1345 [Gemmatimonadetes bacterium]|nr:hypothetical protein [Gemmatimonadota bacterium]
MKWPKAIRAEAAGENIFPLRVPFGRPATTEDFGAVSQKIEVLALSPYPWRIEWEVVKTRKWGRQNWPLAVYFDSIESLAAGIGADEELAHTRNALAGARAVCPALEPWLRLNAHRIARYTESWAGLVEVCAYFAANPRPNCYPRQVPIAVHSKFIESNTGILRELLDAVIPAPERENATPFAERFGLLVEPPQLRFKFLDRQLQIAAGWPVAEASVPVSELREIVWHIPRILVVENRDVFLCLPPLAGTLGVWGSGKAASILGQLPWLCGSEIVYWGDCDEAGFSILSTLRSVFPQVRSALMDLNTWKRWRHFAVPGNRDRAAHSDSLTSEEKEVLAAVIAGPWLLEQERIPSREADVALRAAIGLKNNVE